ncbi:MAG: LPS export ABC transporter periplasmic protein LptC [Alphaproteobacteria bacterium]|mgnify:CR=1 FL=1|nr:LPS export ABC transporter periplasmic protein LptC [Alphaproteobacteria bacterium]MDX5369440.1 LPS export ABC transporter periplasmic protein LptC [Alphaproteobacteria bacterium]MDX5464120.1 LPS export ABC transporter periplasmic protein LptC [Alphaproteobacteria bacterium]
MTPAPARRPRLEGLAGQGGSARDARRYSRFVGVMRVALPVVALLLLAALTLWPVIGERIRALESARVMGEMNVPGDLMKMTRPSYSGADASGRQYSLVADAAYPNGLDPTEVRLETLTATVADPSGRVVTVDAAKGLYFPKREVLELTGGVTVVSNDGTRVETGEATLDLARGTIDAPGALSAGGPYGTLEAARARVSESGERLKFDGGVRLVINPARGPDPGAPASGTESRP